MLFIMKVEAIETGFKGVSVFLNDYVLLKAIQLEQQRLEKAAERYHLTHRDPDEYVLRIPRKIPRIRVS